jgi:hypothetical protein
MMKEDNASSSSHSSSVVTFSFICSWPATDSEVGFIHVTRSDGDEDMCAVWTFPRDSKHWCWSKPASRSMSVVV